MHRALRALMSALVLLILPSCAGAPKGASTPPPSPFLWKATQAGQPGTVYLLGTAHMRPDGERRLDRAIEDAVTASDRVAVELDGRKIDPAETMALMGELAILDGQTLGDLLDEPTRVRAAAAAERCELPGLLESPFEPWFAAVAMAAKCFEALGYGGDSVDQLVLELAEAGDPPRKTVELETMRSQMEALAMPPEDVSSLVATLDSLDVGEFDDIVGAYVANDVTRMVAVRAEAERRMREHPGHLERFLLDRDAAMTAHVQRWLAEGGTSVVAVGALHMVGDEGIVSRLQKAGATVVPVAALGMGDPIELPVDTDVPHVGPGFEAVFGGAVEETVQDVPMGDVVMQSRLYVRRWGMLDELLLSVSTLPAAQVAVAPETMMLAVLNGTAQAMGSADELPEVERTTIAGYDAVRADIGAGNQAIQLAVLVHDGRMVQFISSANVLEAYPLEAVRAAFERLLTTFRFTDG